MSIEAVIFDFDWLLMDTESTGLASWQWEWRQHGLELDVAAFFADHGGDVTEERYARLAELLRAHVDIEPVWAAIGRSAASATGARGGRR